MFENREEKLIAGWGNCIMRGLMICTAHQVPTCSMKWARCVVRMGRGEMHTGFDKRNHLEDLDVGGEIIRRRILKK
jgi:hypothetical protein